VNRQIDVLFDALLKIEHDLYEMKHCLLYSNKQDIKLEDVYRRGLKIAAESVNVMVIFLSVHIITCTLIEN